MKIDVSKNTHEGTIVLWVAQRNHQFTSWWITYTMVQLIIGIQILYIASNLSKTTGRDEVKVVEKWKKTEWSSWKGCFTKFKTYGFFAYELYHHYGDMFYILNQPHWGWYIAVILMFAFWIPLTCPFYFAIYGGDGEFSGFSGMFIDPSGT